MSDYVAKWLLTRLQQDFSWAWDLEDFSMGAASIPSIKNIIIQTDMSEAHEVLNRVKEMNNSEAHNRLFKGGIKMISRDYSIIDQHGMHARPATALLKLARQFRSEISLKKTEKTIQMKSMLNILALALKYGETVISSY